MFRVVPDQLRVSEGWVRCGQCSEIFDASQHLVTPPAEHAPSESTAEPEPPAAAPSAAQSVPDAPDARVVAVERFPEPVAPVAAAGASPAGTATPADTAEQEDAAEREHAAEQDFAPTAIGPDDEPSPGHEAPSPALPEAPQADAPEWLYGPATDPASASPDPEPSGNAATDAPAGADSPAPAAPAGRLRESDAEVDVSFLRDANKPSFWRKRTTRIALLVLLVLLLAGLVAQILVHERDRIVSVEPATRPVLLALCAWSGCSLSPLRQIESVVIDSSSFSRIRGDDYRLGFSLKNNASVDIAMPAIELALTDSQDRAVIRRVILPAEFGATSDALSAMSVWGASLALHVKSRASEDRIAGYRLLAFYP